MLDCESLLAEVKRALGDSVMDAAILLNEVVILVPRTPHR